MSLIKFSRSSENELARANGIPKWLRRYSRRYGAGVSHVLIVHKQFKGR